MAIPKGLATAILSARKRFVQAAAPSTHDLVRGRLGRSEVKHTVGWVALSASLLLCPFVTWPQPAPAVRTQRDFGCRMQRVRYDLSLDVDLDAARIRGHQVIQACNRSSTPLREIPLDLPARSGIGDEQTTNMRMRFSRFVNGGQEMDAFRRGHRVWTRLREPVLPGRVFTIECDFEGGIERVSPEELSLVKHFTRQLSAIMNSRWQEDPVPLCAVQSEDSLVLHHFYGQIPRQSAAGWEPAEREVGFRESAAAPSDLFIDVQLPVEYELFGPGRTVRSQSSPSRWSVSAGPVRTVTLFASRNVEVITNPASQMSIYSVCTPEQKMMGRKLLDMAHRGAELFTKRLGSAPCQNLWVISAPLPAGVSVISSTAMVLIAQALYSDLDGLPMGDLPGLVHESADLIRAGLEFNLVYSIARQWWGEAVSTGSGTEPFMDDALAVYFALLYYADRYGPDAVEEQIDQQLRATYRVYRTFGGADQRLTQSPDKFRNSFQYHAIVHAKGALYLRDIEALLDSAELDRLIGGFYSANRWQATVASGLTERFIEVADVNRKAVEECTRRWLNERRGDADIAKPEFQIIVSTKLSPSREGRPSAFERVGRFIARQMTRVGKAAARPF